MISLTRAHTKKRPKRRYCVSLDPYTVELLREHGLSLSFVVQQLLNQLLLELAGDNKLQLLLELDQKLAEDLQFAARLRHKWDRPEWQQWWQKMAQKYKVKVSDLQRVATQLFGGEQR